MLLEALRVVLISVKAAVLVKDKYRKYIYFHLQSGILVPVALAVWHHIWNSLLLYSQIHSQQGEHLAFSSYCSEKCQFISDV